MQDLNMYLITYLHPVFWQGQIRDLVIIKMFDFFAHIHLSYKDLATTNIERIVHLYY
jgi:hypothetical protein